MADYDALHPEYGWAQNKGYASKAHIEAIQAKGLTELHRTSFCGNFFQESIGF